MTDVDELEKGSSLLLHEHGWVYVVLEVNEDTVRLRSPRGNEIEPSKSDLEELLEGERMGPVA